MKTEYRASKREPSCSLVLTRPELNQMRESKGKDGASVKKKLSSFIP